MPTERTMSGRILIVDDDPVVRELVKGSLQNPEYQVSAVGDGQEAWDFLQTNATDLIVSDVCMPRMDGMDLLRVVQDIPDCPAVILMTAFASLEAAVEATKLGAYDYITKPISVDRLRHLVAKALEERRLREENRRLHRELSGRYGLEEIIGESPQIREVRRLVEDLAASEATTLLLGKSGTGKEMVARAIHALSRRKARPFVAVNCGGLSETLLESELFGHTRGAFTGAVMTRRGLIQEADGGSLFLDEVGEMSPALQVKLLRTLEDREVRPLGSEQRFKVDIRVIAATNRDLRQAMADGHFREDLYYRLNVISLTLPELAERRDDIPMLAQHFLVQACARADRSPLRFSPMTMDLLQAYSWPGNIRELRNVIERAAALVHGAEIRPQHLAPELRATDPIVGVSWWRDGMTLADMERQAVLHALKRTHGNRAEAARRLGISERSLYRRLARLDLRDVR